MGPSDPHLNSYSLMTCLLRDLNYLFTCVYKVIFVDMRDYTRVCE